MAEATKRKASPKLIAIVAVVAVAIVAAGAYWYMNFKVPHDAAVAAFDAAKDGLDQRNAGLDQAISDLQASMASDVEPFDAATKDASSDAIGKAQAARQEAPEMPSGTDEINAKAAEVDKMGDYSEQLSALSDAKKALEDSIAQMRQVTNPSEAFVVQRVTGLPNVVGVEAATEDNDTNGLLHKAGGYTAAVLMQSDLVDQSLVFETPGLTGLPAKGNDGGGTVEVYETADDAEKRDTYLSAFDGTAFDAGSHAVVGTCVIRTSSLLTASQQQAMQQSITDALTRLE